MRVCPNCERVVTGEHCTCFADGQQAAPKSDDAVARARELVREHDDDYAGLVPAIAAALRAERTRALEEKEQDIRERFSHWLGVFWKEIYPEDVFPDCEACKGRDIGAHIVSKVRQILERALKARP